jgi:hypothetical protein
VLAVYQHAPLPLIEHILNEKIKPIFQYNSHPDVNAATGRRLPRSMGGAASYQDHFDHQVWKDNVGVIGLLLWCVCHMEVGNNLFPPPITA